MANVVMTSPDDLARVDPAQHHDLTPQTLGSSIKRKREESNDAAFRVNSKEIISRAASDRNDPRSLYTTQNLIDDFMTVMKGDDPTPSILSRPLPTRSSSSEPDPKRKKVDQDSGLPNIARRVKTASYKNLEGLVGDVKDACDAALDEMILASSDTHASSHFSLDNSSGTVSKIKAFRKKAEQLLKMEKAYETRYSKKSSGVDAEGDRTQANGTTHPAIQVAVGDENLVLTLFGNAPGPRQMFSSLQQTVDSSDDLAGAEVSLRETPLPPGISTTQIVEVRATRQHSEKKSAQTIGEVFDIPPALPFPIPKPSKHSTTRGSTVGWYQPTGVDSQRARNSQSYHEQSISTGRWIDYGGMSVEKKRKQRDRTLSMSGTHNLEEASDVDRKAAKLDAMFISCYSSFAPSRDDAAAIVPASQMSRIWWDRTGNKSFRRLVKNAELMDAAETSDSDQNLASNDRPTTKVDEDEQFKEMVDRWVAIDPSLQDTNAPVPTSIRDKDAEEVLQGISELLQELSSYQRNRFLAVNPTPRLSSTSGVEPASAKPSDVELATYETLKSQLTLMIQMLPPFALAKLDSDKLGELLISTKIPVHLENRKGIMDEDEYASRAKALAMSNSVNSRAPPTSSLHRSSSSSNMYGNQYSSSSRPTLPNGQYFPQNQTPVRSASSTIQRGPPPTAPALFGGQRSLQNNNYRPQSHGTPLYPHQVARPQQQFFQTPSTPSFNANPGQSYGVPQSAPQNTRYQPSTSYQRPQASTNGITYPYGGPNGSPRHPSPQKPQPYSPQSHTVQPNRSYGPSTPSIGQDRRYYPTAAANGTPTITAQSHGVQSSLGHASANVGATGYHTVMTEAEQSTMMERQRAQIAQQQGIQQQARNAAQTVLGGSPKQMNGASAVSAGS